MSTKTKRAGRSPKSGRVRQSRAIRGSAYRKLLELKIQKNSMDEIAEHVPIEEGSTRFEKLKS
jgi:hypothetical protein